MGEDELKKLVQSNFDNRSSQRASIEYQLRQMPFNEENVNASSKSSAGPHEFGQELAMPFTQNVANEVPFRRSRSRVATSRRSHAI